MLPTMTSFSSCLMRVISNNSYSVMPQCSEWNIGSTDVNVAEAQAMRQFVVENAIDVGVQDS